MRCSLAVSGWGVRRDTLTNPNDAIRHQILQYFYDRNQNATSEKGKRGSHIRISDAKRELKARYGFNQQQVVSQLNYLISSGWVDKVSEERMFTTRTGTQQPSTNIWYVISSKGIDRIEGQSSEFMRQNPYSDVNITAVNSAIQLGNGNVVNRSFVGLAEDLGQLSQAIAASDLTEEEKMSAIADIETINGQLAKPNPSREIIKIAWGALTNGKAASLIRSGEGIVRAIEAMTA